MTPSDDYLSKVDGLPPDKLDRDQSRWLRQSPLWRALIGVIAGAFPGTLIAYFGSQRIGLAVVLLGIPIGIAMALGRASPLRTVRLFIAIVVAKNIPFIGDNAFKWVDEGGDSDSESDLAAERLMRWLAAGGAPKRSLWVLWALVAGTIGGAGLVAHDVLAMQAGSPAYVLRTPGAKDSLFLQAVLVMIAVPIWTAAAMGIVASVPYRRSIILAIIVAGYICGCIGLAADRGRGIATLQVIVFYATQATGLALLLTALGFFEEYLTDGAITDPDDDSNEAFE